MAHVPMQKYASVLGRHLEVMACHEGTQPQEVGRKLQAAATSGTLISLQGLELMPDVVCTVIAAQLRSILKVQVPRHQPPVHRHLCMLARA